MRERLRADAAMVNARWAVVCISLMPMRLEWVGIFVARMKRNGIRDCYAPLRTILATGSQQ